jgi:hypothetical protein
MYVNLNPNAEASNRAGLIRSHTTDYDPAMLPKVVLLQCAAHGLAYFHYADCMCVRCEEAAGRGAE